VLIKGAFGWSSVDPKIAVDGVLFFRAGSALWRSDGTEAGTTLIRDGILAPEFGFTACGGSFAVVNGVLVFPGRDENGCELWRSEGVTAELLMDINPGPASSMRLNLTSPFTEASGLVLFAADDGVHGMELWATDGTSTTRMMKVFPGAGGSGARSFIRFGPQVFFTAFEPDSGGELWALSLSDLHQGLNLAETRANLDAPDQSRSRWRTSMRFQVTRAVIAFAVDKERRCPIDAAHQSGFEIVFNACGKGFRGHIKIKTLDVEAKQLCVFTEGMSP